MATNKVVSDAPKQDSCGAVVNQGDSSVRLRIIQVPAKCGPITTQSSAVTTPHKIISIGQGSQPASCPVTAPGIHHTPSSVMVVAKPTTQRGMSLVKQPVANQAVSQASTPGKTVVITVPRSAAPQPVAPVLPQTASPQLPANIQIPAGMMLISSDSGQLMLVSQQALVQAQQRSRIVSGQAPRILTQQVSTAVGSKSNEKVTVIRMAAPSMFQPAPLQKTAVVIGVSPKSAVVPSHGTTSEPGKHLPIQTASTDSKKQPLVTFSQETLESVKKCKNFLVTLIKLASSDSRSTNMANNVRGLIKNLLEGKIEAEEFTEQLYNELKSTPQPCLVPFLKKSLPAVRSLTADPQLFIQQASSSVCNPATVSSSTKQSITDAGDTMKTSQQETLESVKKCKNFLVTLIKLASSDSRSTNMANNVRGLIKNLLEGKIEAEEFTEQLYNELKSTPQPCLVPFLKKSLPAVRSLTADPQLFIQQASSSVCNPATVSSSTKQSITDAGDTMKTSQQWCLTLQQALRPGSILAQSRNCMSTKIGPTVKQTMVQSRKHIPGTFLIKQSVALDPTWSTKLAFRDTPGSYKEDDDINDVASMAGVNLREENARILTTTVGSVVQSCHDQLFLSPQLVRSRILHTGLAVGVTDVGPEVVALISHATQQYLCGLMEKLTVMAEHRRVVLKEDQWYAKGSDVRSQLRFLEEVERLKKKRKDEEERETLLRLARSRSHTEDPQLQQLKQKAKEFQQLEEALLQQREANLTALAAIGPRKKRALDQTESQVNLLPRLGVQRVTRVTLKDLLMCMEQEYFLRHSLTFYKATLSLV